MQGAQEVDHLHGLGAGAQGLPLCEVLHGIQGQHGQGMLLLLLGQDNITGMSGAALLAERKMSRDLCGKCVKRLCVSR